MARSIREQARENLKREARRQNANVESGKNTKMDIRTTSRYGPRTKGIMDDLKAEVALDDWASKKLKK
jgi:hypothetical protein